MVMVVQAVGVQMVQPHFQEEMVQPEYTPVIQRTGVVQVVEVLVLLVMEEMLVLQMGEPVDLVMADAVRNPYVRRDIEASKRLIYGVVA